MSNPVRVGIIGAGRAAEKLYVPSLPRTTGGQVVAITDMRAERRDLIASQIPGCTAYESVDQMLAEADLSAVVVATPPAAHIDVTRQALDAGCAALVEKPLAEDLGEARQLIADLPACKDKVVVGYNRRHWLPVKRMKDAMRGVDLSGATIDAAFCIDVSGWAPVAGAIDPIDDLGSHYLDLVRFILDDEIVSLSATRPKERAIEIRLKTAKGADVKLFHEHGGDTYEYFHVKAGGNEHKLVMGSDRISPADGPGRKAGDLIDKVKRKLTGGGWTLGDSYVQQFNDFFAVAAGRGKPSPDVNDGMQCMIAVSAAKDSADQGGKEIQLDDDASNH